MATHEHESGVESRAEIRGSGAIAQGPGSVAVAGDVHGPIHTGTGNIVQNITQYVTNPPPIRTIFRDIGELFKRNRLLIGLTFALQIPLAILFFAYRDRYLLSDWIYLTLAFLLAFVGWRWLKLIRERPPRATLRRSLYLTSLITLAWVSILSHQTWTMAHPRKFLDNQFGIAVSTFGEGTNSRSSRLGREITQQLLDDLNEAIRQESGRVRIGKETTRDPATLRIGVVREDLQATEDGERVGAELVLWGRVLEEKKGSEIHFQALETPDITDNPSFPQTMLVETGLRSKIALTSTNPVDVMNAVSAQNAVIIHYSLGLYYYLNLDFESAVDQFESALDYAKPATSKTNLVDPAIVYYYLGKSYQFLEKYEEAQAALEEAARLNPKEPAIALAQAYNQRAMGHEEEKQNALQRAIDLCNRLPSTKAVIYDRALAYEGQGDLEAALREYEALLREEPDFFIAYLSSARILSQFDRYDEAMARYQQAARLADGQAAKQAWLSLDLGSLYERMKQPDEALAQYSQAIALDPTLSGPYFRRAQFYEKTGMINAASQDYQKLAEISSQPHWAHETFAEFLRRTGNCTAAVDQYQEALRYPVFNNALTHARLGRAYACSDEQAFPDKQERANDEFKKALRAPGPDEAYIRSEYGWVLAGFGLNQDAIEQLKRSIEVNPGIDTVTMLNLGQLYETVGDTAMAMETYEKVVSRESEIPKEAFEKALQRLANLADKEIE